ncbi:hypothetical protein U9M48_004222 [Paspalum notatum var. saurae]|uniref:Uncharacterized protein n=1 Tax=Paspalum notatum var. saurae TaxID=547442 RepID=A0AAQ3SL72_PASNO
MAAQGPAGYYEGPPTNSGVQNAPPPQPQTVDAAEANTQVPGYYVHSVAAPAGQTNKESGCLAKCFGCFCGGGAAAS